MELPQTVSSPLPPGRARPGGRSDAAPRRRGAGKELRQLAVYWSIRKLESRCTVAGLFRLMAGYMRFQSLCNRPFIRLWRRLTGKTGADGRGREIQKTDTVPAGKGNGGRRAVPWVQEAAGSCRYSPQRVFFNQALEMIPDRLRNRKWRRRLSVQGLEHVSRLREAGRPVILAFCHFGPYFLFRPLLRSIGIPLCTFAGGAREVRRKFRCYADRFEWFPDVPRIFYRDDLRSAVEVLKEGGVLMMAVDAPAAQEFDISLPGGGLKMAAGALRMAARTGAVIVPCCIFDRGHWRFRLEFGPPVEVPPNAAVKELRAPAEELAGRLIALMEKHPVQCGGTLLKSLYRDPEPGRPGSKGLVPVGPGEPGTDAE